MNEESALVLIVDDEPANRTVLVNLMKVLGYRAVTAADGASALETARERKPDVILLDISMPVMDGYQTLVHLKAEGELSEIPVIMVSGLEENENTSRCLKLGADDYLAKPYHSILLRARLNACLKRNQIKQMESRHLQELAKLNQSLEMRVLAKSRDLIEAKRRLAILDQTKREFLQLISHQLRTPVTGLLGVSDILFDHGGELDVATREEFADLYRRSRDTMLSILDQALLMTQIQSGDAEIRREECRLEDALAEAVVKAQEFALMRRVAIVDLSKFSVDTRLDANMDLLVTALATIIKVGVIFSRSGGELRLIRTHQDLEIRLDVQADGDSVEDSILTRVWEIFLTSQASHPASELGLGPPLGARIIQLFNGRVEAISLPEGVRIRIAFPQNEIVDPKFP